MTKEQKEFMKHLELVDYKYSVEDGIINIAGGAILSDTMHAPYVMVYIYIPAGVRFTNEGDVFIGCVNNISDEVIFDNGGKVEFDE